LACFDKAKGALKGGKECLNVVKEGDEVRVAAVGSSFNKKITGPAEPQCTAGEGKKTALGAEGITEDANFKYAAWPPSTLKLVKPVDPATLRPDKIQLSDDEKQKLAAATKKGTADELKVHQVAEVHVDANGQADKLYSVYIPHPTQSEIFTYSGMFLARDGNLDELTLVERGKGRELIKVRGTVDLNGDGTSELWIALMFGDSEGGGDRVVQLDGKKVKALAPWTCGV
jgi:hypothetical protein